MTNSTTGLRIASLIALATLVSGCGRNDDIAVYEVPKSGSPAPTTAPFANPVDQPDSAAKADAPGSMQVLPGMAESSSGFPQPRWTVPGGWTELPAQPPRRGSFTAQDAEIAVTVFPGDVGGVQANAARWARQVNVAVDPNGIAPVARVPLADGSEALVFQFDGSQPTGPASIRGAILSRPDHTWFVKLSGPTDVVNALGDSFDAFTGSFRF